MKKGIHPTAYKPVLFQDVNNGKTALLRSTINIGTDPETKVWEDGNTYPLVKVQVSGSSHSFFTGAKVEIDELGQIAKFHAKFGKKG